MYIRSAPTTLLPSTPLPTTLLPSTPLPSTPLSSTPLPTTPLPSTPLPSTPLPSTPLPSTPLPSTPLQWASMTDEQRLPYQRKAVIFRVAHTAAVSGVKMPSVSVSTSTSVSSQIASVLQQNIGSQSSNAGG